MRVDRQGWPGAGLALGPTAPRSLCNKSRRSTYSIVPKGSRWSLAFSLRQIWGREKIRARCEWGECDQVQSNFSLLVSEDPYIISRRGTANSHRAPVAYRDHLFRTKAGLIPANSLA